MKTLSYKRLAILFVLLFLTLLGPQHVLAQNPSTYAALTISGVTTGTPAIGSDFTTDVGISVNTNQPGLSGIELFLSYNPTTVDPVDTNTSTPGVQPAQILLTGVFPAANEVITAPDTLAPGLNVPGRKCALGSYPCVHLSFAETPAQTSQDVVVARLAWRGKAVGATGFLILNPLTPQAPNPPQPRTAFSDADGYPIPINSVVASNFSIVNPGRIGGVVLRQGVPPSIPNTGTHGCTQIDSVVADPFSSIPAFTLITTSASPTFPPQVNTSGGFILTVNSGAGTYKVRASYPGYLQAEKAGVYVSGADYLVGTTKLWGGDVNGDGKIDILDIVTVIGNLGLTGPIRSSTASCAALAGTQPMPPAAVPADLAADINDDGIVDISDLAIAAGNFGKTGPTAWAP